MFHAAGNTLSDWFDYRHNVDAADTYGAKTLTDKMFSPREILTLALVLLVAASAVGVALVAASGVKLLWIGVAGAVLTVLYTFLKFNALGDVDIFLNFALLPTLGTSFVASGATDWSVLWLALPIGLITVAILHCNNTRDVSTDSRAGIYTLPMAIGRKASMAAYGFEVLFPFAWVAGCVVGGVFPLWTLVVLPALLPAVANLRMMLTFKDGEVSKIGFLDRKTAQLQLLFSLLLSAAFVISKLCSLL